MVCKKCSATIPDDGMFCPVCGARADGNKPCPKCEKLIPETSVFCAYCGSKVDDGIVCPNCSAMQPSNTVFCSSCGTRIDNKHNCKNCNFAFEGEFCPNCGAKFGEVTDSQAVSVEPMVVPVVVPVPVSGSTPAVTEDNSNVNATPTDITEEPTNNNADIQEDNPTSNEESDAVSEDNATTEDVPLVQGVVCTQCGSSDVELISETLGKCQNCGAQVVIATPKEDNYITNNVTIQMTGNGVDNSIGYFELPIEMDESTFYANALTQIALDKDSPDDIFEIGKFEPVKTVYRQYALAKGTAQMTYSATIGYDRTIHVTEYDAARGSNVTKTKKVTDWQPFSGSHIGEYIDATSNDNNPDDFDAYDYKANCLSISKDYDEINSKLPAPLVPSSSAINSLEAGIRASAQADCKNSLPGDRNKNFNCNGTVTLSVLESHVAPQYILKYKYLGKGYDLKAHSCKKSMIRGDIPSAKTEIEAEIEDNHLVKTFNFITLFTLLFSILSAIIFPIALKILFAVIGITSFITYWVVRSKTSKAIYYDKANKKKSTLIAYLKKKGIKIPKELQSGVQK